MSAEEILNSNCIAIEAGEYLIDCDKAHTVVEEYARQRATSFAEWLGESHWRKHPDYEDLWYVPSDKFDEPFETGTTEGLYNMFVQFILSKK